MSLRDVCRATVVAALPEVKILSCRSPRLWSDDAMRCNVSRILAFPQVTGLVLQSCRTTLRECVRAV